MIAHCRGSGGALDVQPNSYGMAVDSTDVSTNGIDGRQCPRLNKEGVVWISRPSTLL